MDRITPENTPPERRTVAEERSNIQAARNGGGHVTFRDDVIVEPRSAVVSPPRGLASRARTPSPFLSPIRLSSSPIAPRKAVENDEELRRSVDWQTSAMAAAQSAPYISLSGGTDALPFVGQMDHMGAIQRLVETLKRQCFEKDLEIGNLERRLFDLSENERETLKNRGGLRNDAALDHTPREAELLREVAALRQLNVGLENALQDHREGHSSGAAGANGQNLKFLKVQDEQLAALKEALRAKDDENLLLTRKLAATEESLMALEVSNSESQRLRVQQALEHQEKEHSDKVSRLLSRHDASIRGLATRQLQSGAQEIDTLQWELEKKASLMASLQEDLRRHRTLVLELEEENDALQLAKQELESGQVVAVRQHKADAEARISLNAAELHVKTMQNESLMQRVAEVEELLRQKDDEIRSVRRQLGEKDSALLTLQREVNAARYEVNFKDLTLADVEKAAENRVDSITALLRRQKEEHERSVSLEASKWEHTLEEQRRRYEQLNDEMPQLQAKIDAKDAEIEAIKRVLGQKESAIADLRSQTLELESQLYANDKTVEVEYLRKAEHELKQRVEEQAVRIEVFQQDSAILQNIRAENADLQRQVVELRGMLRNTTASHQQLQQIRQEGTSASVRGDFSSTSSAHSRRSPSSSSVVAPFHSAQFNAEPRALPPHSVTSSYLPPPSAPIHPIVRMPQQGVRQPSAGTSDSGTIVSDKSSHSMHFPPRQDQSMISFTEQSGTVYRGTSPADQKLADFLSSLPPRLRLTVHKDGDGAYLIGSRRTNLKCINGNLMAQVGSSWMPIADFFAAERHSSRN